MQTIPPSQSVPPVGRCCRDALISPPARPVPRAGRRTPAHIGPARTEEKAASRGVVVPPLPSACATSRADCPPAMDSQHSPPRLLAHRLLVHFGPLHGTALWLMVLAVLTCRIAPAQCVPTEVRWQIASTNRLRCGFASAKATPPATEWHTQYRRGFFKTPERQGFV